MKTHSYEIDETFSSVNIISSSRAADTATLSLPLNSVDEEPPFAFGDEVYLKENGNILFHGYVADEPEVSISAGGISCDIKLSNIVALLDATPYVYDQSLRDILSNEARLIRASSAVSQIVSAGMVLPGGAPADERFSIEFDSTIKCPSGSGSQSCWSLVNSCLHWVPDAVTWYDPIKRKLTFRSARDGGVMTLDVSSGVARRGDSELFSFAGYESASFKPRHDLCPPVVGLSWEGTSKDKVFPAGGNLRQPWAFMFQIPKITGASVNDELPPQERRQVQKAAEQSMLVQGLQVPEGWAYSGNMKVEAPGKPKDWHKFWSSFSAFNPLAKTNVSCLSYGLAVFEPVPVGDAFPPGELADDNEQPENYKAFGPDEKIYVLLRGQFPASSKKRENVNGLKFCKGKLKQYVWIKSLYTGTLSREEWQEFFSGSAKLKKGDLNGTTRYALLELDAIFINRRRKKYKTGTNELDSSDEDFTNEEQPEDTPNDNTSGMATDADYTAAAESYYNATRKLYWDGSITLRGVDGYYPSLLDGANLSIIGARSEWATMESPVVQAEYNPQYKTLTLTTGSPEILSIDERLQRMLIGRQSNANAGTSLANEPDIQQEQPDAPDTPDTPEVQPEPQGFPMISPSISAQVAAVKSGRPLNPFEIYSEGSGVNEKWYVNEGTMTAPGGKIVNFETTDITELKKNYPDAKFSVRVERKAGSTEWEAVVRHYTPKKQS